MYDSFSYVFTSMVILWARWHKRFTVHGSLCLCASYQLCATNWYRHRSACRKHSIRNIFSSFILSDLNRSCIISKPTAFCITRLNRSGLKSCVIICFMSVTGITDTPTYQQADKQADRKPKRLSTCCCWWSGFTASCLSLGHNCVLCVHWLCHELVKEDDCCFSYLSLIWIYAIVAELQALLCSNLSYSFSLGYRRYSLVLMKPWIQATWLSAQVTVSASFHSVFLIICWSLRATKFRHVIKMILLLLGISYVCVCASELVLHMWVYLHVLLWLC